MEYRRGGVKVLIGRTAVVELPELPVELGTLPGDRAARVAQALEDTRPSLEREARMAGAAIAGALLDLLWGEGA
jgi:hypothetical protein